MNKNENLMVVAMEECAEVQQALSKAIRFGADNHHPNEPETTNGYQVLKEFHQLRAVMDMIVSRGYIPNIPDEEVETIYNDKISAVNCWERYSRNVGLIKDEKN